MFAFWYFLPAGAGNVAPIIAAKTPILKKWNTPLDGGRMYKGKRLLGDHKTVRGIVCGVLAGVFIGAVQWSLADTLHDVYPAMLLEVHGNVTALVLGGLLAFGALAGDALESFFKRQADVPSGQKWFPYDQIDYILGACVFGSIFGLLTAPQYGAILFLWFGMHLLFSYIGYLLKFKSQPI